MKRKALQLCKTRRRALMWKGQYRTWQPRNAPLLICSVINMSNRVYRERTKGLWGRWATG